MNASLQNFFLPAECNEVIFLRSKLCILHQNGFNLVKLPEYECLPLAFFSFNSKT